MSASTTASTPATVTIDIFSDVMCPWCLVGWGQLSKALAALDGEIAADIRWRPFELNPDMPEEGEERSAHLAKKYRRSAEETAAVIGQMGQAAHDAGVSLDYAGDTDTAPPAMMWNTLTAHKLLKWALDNHGPHQQMALKLALFEAHFNHRRRIGERAVLLDIVEETGLDRERAAMALDDPALTAQVRAEEQQARAMNITGVPAMVVDGTFLIPGAQGAETYADVLRRVVAKRSA